MIALKTRFYRWLTDALTLWEGPPEDHETLQPFATVLRQALAADPENRYDLADKIKNALAEFPLVVGS